MEALRTCRFSQALVALAATALVCFATWAGPPVRKVTFFFYGAPIGTSDAFLEERRAQAGKDFQARGWVEGRNLAITVVNAGVDPAEIRRRAQAVVASRPDVICVPGNAGARLFQSLARDIPIVFFGVADPESAGLVQSLRRPGGNVTGVSNRYAQLEAKRLELLKELRPEARRIAVLARPGSVRTDGALGARAKSLQIELVAVVAEWNDDAATVRLVQQAAPEGVLAGFDAVAPDGVVMRYLTEARIPAVFSDDGVVIDGGLVSLGSRWDEQSRRAVDLAARILRGESPGSIPVDQLASPYIAVNLRTARAMGITIPGSIRIRADRLIE